MDTMTILTGASIGTMAVASLIGLAAWAWDAWKARR